MEATYAECRFCGSSMIIETTQPLLKDEADHYAIQKCTCAGAIRYRALGLMASEGGQREKALIKNGCNYYGKTTTRSCPFTIFMRQDLLQLALDLKVPVPEIYGTIERAPDSTLYTTRAQRTGCSMCGFGIHIEKRPHRFDRLSEDNSKEWEFWMHTMGWGEVLDYIGIGWKDHPGSQLEMEGAMGR